MIEFLKIELGGKEYKTKSIPTVGEFIDVETLKVAFSGGTYEKMIMSTTKNAIFAADLIASQAYISKFFPKYLETLDNGFDNLPITESVEIVKAYRKQLLPQINELTKMISDLSLDE